MQVAIYGGIKMSSYRTVVKVLEPAMDEEGNYLDKDGKVIDFMKKTTKLQEPATEEVLYHLLHWGLHMEIFQDNKTGQRYPATYTVGICQHIKTGKVKIFAPEEMTIIGKEKI